jgi:hypothetical protein
MSVGSIFVTVGMSVGSVGEKPLAYSFPGAVVRIYTPESYY